LGLKTCFASSLGRFSKVSLDSFVKGVFHVGIIVDDDSKLIYLVLREDASKTERFLGAIKAYEIRREKGVFYRIRCVDFKNFLEHKF